ncbi:MAG: hypothetical protein RLZZ627_464 [Pseudomonadota bacterium]|jgi:two-component system catabolic regulation response regulator CreB
MDVIQPLILIIEDEVPFRDSLAALLRLDAYRVEGVTSGREGLHEIRAGRADLVLLDVGLPDCNGFALFHEIREISPVPVIFMTARGEVVDRVTGLELGADDYLPKPFDYRELLARVRVALRRASRHPLPPASPAAGTTPFLIEPEKRRIRIQDQILDLTPLEYGILKTLIERPGHVYSRDYLMDTLWNEPFTASDRSIDQHVKTLRRKIGQVMGESPVILTHRGSGYALRDDW